MNISSKVDKTISELTDSSTFTLYIEKRVDDAVAAYASRNWRLITVLGAVIVGLAGFLGGQVYYMSDKISSAREIISNAEAREKMLKDLGEERKATLDAYKNFLAAEQGGLAGKLKGLDSQESTLSVKIKSDNSQVRNLITDGKNKIVQLEQDKDRVVRESQASAKAAVEDESKKLATKNKTALDEESKRIETDVNKWKIDTGKHLEEVAQKAAASEQGAAKAADSAQKAAVNAQGAADLLNKAATGKLGFVMSDSEKVYDGSEHEFDGLGKSFKIKWTRAAGEKALTFPKALKITDVSQQQLDVTFESPGQIKPVGSLGAVILLDKCDPNGIGTSYCLVKVGVPLSF